MARRQSPGASLPARVALRQKARSPDPRPPQIAELAAAGQLTPAVAEAALTLLQLCKERGVEAGIVRTMQMVAMEIGEALARQHAPPSTRLVEALAPLDLGDEKEEEEARRLMAAAFAPGGEVTRDEFVADVLFFLEARCAAMTFFSSALTRRVARAQSLDETENAFTASVSEAVQSGSNEAFLEVKRASDGRRDARMRMSGLLALAKEFAA